MNPASTENTSSEVNIVRTSLAKNFQLQIESFTLYWTKLTQPAILPKKAPKLFQFNQCYDFYFIPCGNQEPPPGYLALTVLLNP